MSESLFTAVILLLVGVSIVFLFLGAIFLGINIISVIFKPKKFKIEPDKSIIQNDDEMEELAAIAAAITFLRESRYRYASIPKKEIKSNWNFL